ncbi:MAG: S8 family serine peptidase [Bradyrhizobium sp.]|nr:S8 family serine peptidase [Bradyrhizobium sp.]
MIKKLSTRPKAKKANTNRAHAHLNDGTHVVLAGSRRYHRAGTQVLGRADTHEWCDITIKLRRAEELPEPVAGKAVVSRADFDHRYGADTNDLATVEDVLGKAGLTIEAKDGATRKIKAGGPVEAMENLFQLHLLRMQHGDHFYRGRVGDIHIPKALNGIVTGVFGLDARRMTRHRRGRIAHAATQEVPPAANRPWFLPQELASIYQFPPGGGDGQTIGIIELGGQYIASDLAEFAQITELGVPPKVVIVEAEKLSPQDRNDPSAIGECMLDVEVVAGVCPRSTLAVYFSNFTEKGWVDVLDAALHDGANKPSVLSISYGLAEGTNIWTGQAMRAINDTLKEAAALGVPVCIAAGDDGSDDQVGDGAAHVDFPSTSPFVLCVGGTALKKRNGSGFTETTWFDGDGLRADGGGSTGGGVSEVIARPTWQKNIAIVSVNPQAPAGRCVPDVAADAAGSTGYFMVAQDNPQVSGGTSAAAPLWAALLARLMANGKTLGFFTPLLYQASAKTAGQPLGAAALTDITEGGNATAAAGGYRAAAGFDAVTGWGSPNGANLMKLL